MFKQISISIILLFLFSCQTNNTQNIRGAWKPKTYLLKDRSQHPVDGLIFFTETDWAVLFFVLDENDTPQKGSGEAGTYTLNKNQLVFTHNYHLSGGNPVGNLSASPLKMEIKNAAEASTENCTIEFNQNNLTIYFPSGNSMTFQRKSGFQK
jgi:hypothetical protein